MELTCDWITAEETIPRAVSAAKLQLDSLWGSHGEAPAIERGNVLRVYTARTDFDGLWWLQKVPVDPQRRTFQVPIRQICLGGLRGEGFEARLRSLKSANLRDLRLRNHVFRFIPSTNTDQVESP